MVKLNIFSDELLPVCCPKLEISIHLPEFPSYSEAYSGIYQHAIGLEDLTDKGSIQCHSNYYLLQTNYFLFPAKGIYPVYRKENDNDTYFAHINGPSKQNILFHNKIAFSSNWFFSRFLTPWAFGGADETPGSAQASIYVGISHFLCPGTKVDKEAFGWKYPIR